MELQNLGWNAASVGFVGTLVFTVVEAWGLLQQNKAIWRSRSGRSVSVTWFSYFAALSFAYGVYALTIGSIALVFNGFVLALFHAPIIVGLWKFKGFSRVEKFLGACFLAAMAVTILTPAKDWFVLLFSFGSIVSYLAQPLEIWRRKSSGVVEIRLLAVYFVSTSFWVLYAFAVGNWVLRITCPAYLVILGATIALWFRYRPARTEKT